MPEEEARKIEKVPVPDELKGDMPLAHEIREPCKLCGGSMEGEHHLAKSHKKCKAEKQKAVSTAWNEAHKDKPVVDLLPELKVEGKKVELDEFVLAIHRYMKHTLGLSKNGVSMSIDEIRSGCPSAAMIDVVVEIEKKLAPLPFGDPDTNRGLLCDALMQVWTKDCQGMWVKY